ncbi:MAG: hypothetical protein QOI12_3705 [Alphaproteobacteria bacterium]|nr:hypothetical protein [Alphaproteobacteria bacterium]
MSGGIAATRWIKLQRAHRRAGSNDDGRSKGNPGSARVPSAACAYTSLTFLSGRLRIGLPVAARIALITAGRTTQMVGSPTPPQKS